MLLERTNLEQTFRGIIEKRVNPQSRLSPFSWHDSHIKPIRVMRLKWLETVEMIGTTCDATIFVRRNQLHIACVIYSRTHINAMLPKNGCICIRVVATDI